MGLVMTSQTKKEHCDSVVCPCNIGKRIQLDIFSQEVTGYDVRPIDSVTTYPFLLQIHYARRLPPISYAYGLFLDNELVGVVTYGYPASASLVVGICGRKYADRVLELNRLCLRDNKPHEASRLVAASLKLLPKPKIIVSYADTSQDHTGIVYQATNFLYTGLSAKRQEWAIKGKEHLHSRTISKSSSGTGRIVDNLKEQYGDDFYYRERPRKHRYIMFLGSRSDKRTMLKAFKYDILPYPKKQVD